MTNADDKLQSPYVDLLGVNFLKIILKELRETVNTPELFTFDNETRVMPGCKQTLLWVQDLRELYQQ
jgi:hypothetical protein